MLVNTVSPSLPPLSQICCWYNLLILMPPSCLRPSSWRGRSSSRYTCVNLSSLVWFDLLFTLIAPSFSSFFPAFASSPPPLFSFLSLLSFPPSLLPSSSSPSLSHLLLKHKKLTITEEGEEKLEFSTMGTSFDAQDTDAQENSFAMDLSNSVKNGYLYMQDPIDKVHP